MSSRGKKINGIIRSEISRWLKERIIDDKLAEKLRGLYPFEKIESGHSVSKRIPSIIIGFSVILLGAGIILFYAANWKTMPPWLKLTQVFVIITLFYGLSFYHLAFRDEKSKLGRGLLILGIITFGAGIMLVAQVYHISAHPATGILVWAIGSLLMSAIVDERYGYYLTIILFFIWNIWELTVYQNPNFIFFIFPAIILIFMVRLKDNIGVFTTTIMLIMYFLQISGHWLSVLNSKERFLIEGLLIFSLGMFLLVISRHRRVDNHFRPVLDGIHMLSVLFLLTSLLKVSWNFEIKILFPFLSFNIPPVSIIYITLSVFAVVLIYYLKISGEKILLPASLVIITILYLLLPMGNKITLMISTHLGMVSLIFVILYDSYAYQEKSIIRVTAIIFSVAIIVVKAAGLLLLGVFSRGYSVGYGIGSIVFITVCFLINQMIKFLMERKNIPYSGKTVNSVTAIMGYWALYFLSFKLNVTQKSIYGSETIVIVMLILFIAVALFQYIYLWFVKSEKQPLIISGTVFFTSLIVLLITGPWMNKDTLTIIFNLLLFIMTGSVIYYAVHINSAAVANIAVAGFLIHILTRYFDIFWDLLSGSIFILITGTVLLLIGYFLEKSRKKIILKIENRGA